MPFVSLRSPMVLLTLVLVSQSLFAWQDAADQRSQPESVAALTKSSPAKSEALSFQYAVPHVPAGDRGWQVEVVLTNPGHELCDFRVRVHETQPTLGIVQETEVRTLLPKSAIDLNDLLEEPGGDRWLSIESSHALAGTVSIRRQGAGQEERAQYPLIPVPDQPTQLFFPHVPADRDQFWAGLALVNHGDATELTVSLWGEQGQELSHLLHPSFREINLPANDKLLSLFADQLFDDRASSDKVSWISVAAQQPLTGVALFGLRQGDQLGDLASLTAVTPEQLTPRIWTPVSLDRVAYQAMVILNPHEDSLTLTADLWDRDGISLGTHRFTLGPKQKLLSLASPNGLTLPFGPQLPALSLDDQQILKLASIAIQADQPFLTVQLEGQPGQIIGGHRVSPPRSAWVAATGQTSEHAVLHLRSTSQGDSPHDILIRAQAPNGERIFERTVTLQPRSALDLSLPALPAQSHLLCQDQATEPGLSVWLSEGTDQQRNRLAVGHTYRLPPPLPSVESLQVDPQAEIPGVAAPEADWMAANSHPLQSITANHFADLDFLQGYLAERRLVQLGESSHGAREFNQTKVRLIQYLHQEMGFDVIAFESGLFECDWTGKNMSLLSPESAMFSSIFGVWSTQEVKTLFEYILRTQRSNRPLRLTGFDVQISSLGGARRRPNFLYSMIQPLNQEFAEEVRSLDTNFVNNNQGQAWFLANRQNLFETYRQALDILKSERDRLVELLPPSLVSEIPLTIQILEGQMFQLESLNARHVQQNAVRAFELRDTGMAAAITYLAREAYPDRKIMIWAHNSHIRHDGPNAESSPFGRPREMGYWLHQRHREELYTIGLYMVRGASADNLRTTQPVLPPRTARSIESLFHSTRHAYAFLDLLHQQETPANRWLFTSPGTEHWYWGRWGAEIFIPRKNFDALLVIDSTSVPDYL